MSNEICLPAYNVLIPNSTYGRKAESIEISMMGESFPATEILQISAYKIPSSEEIVGCAHSKAEKFVRDSKLEEGILNEILRRFPEKNLKEIQEGSPEAISHLKRHCPLELAGTSGVFYLQAANGIIPNLILNRAAEDIKRVGHMAYASLIENIGEREWFLKVAITDKKMFPDSLELEYMMDREVRNCRLFKVEGEYGDYKNFASQMRMLYTTINSTEKMNQVMNVSEEFLRNAAAVTLHQTAECILRIKNAKDNLESIFEKLDQFDCSLKEKTAQKSPHRFKRFSDN